MNSRQKEYKKVEKILFFLEGQPIAQKRPRFSREKGCYNPQSKEKKGLQVELLKQMREKGVFSVCDGVLGLEITFGTPIPKNLSQKARKRIQNTFNGKRPDLDNYLKFYLDVMNKIVYLDDNQVAEIICKKVYTDSPSVKIKVNNLTLG